jgi:hypothetical protein
MNKSKVCFVASLLSVAASIGIWAFAGGELDAAHEHAERWGLFVGLWAPTLMGMSNHFKKCC